MILICPAIYQRGSTRLLALRDWPKSYWIDLCALIIERVNFRIVLEANQTYLFSKFSSLVVCPNGVSGLIDTIRNAQLVVTQDSGIMHLARFLEVEVIALFGPTNPNVFATRFEHVIRINDLPCSPCHNGRAFQINCLDNQCMKLITPERVAKEVLKLAEK